MGRLLLLLFLFVATTSFSQKKQNDYFVVEKTNKKQVKIKENIIVCVFLKNGIYKKGKLTIINKALALIKKDTVNISEIKAICKYGIPKRALSYYLMATSGLTISYGLSIIINHPNAKKTAKAFIISGIPYFLSGILIKQKHWRRIVSVST